MKFTLVVIMLFWSGLALSQSIQLLEKKSGEPIPDVFVYTENQKITISSDKNGRINLDGFPSTGKVIFQHPGFEKKIINALKLKSLTKIEFMDRLVDFEDIVISANRWSQNPSAVAQDITSINKKTIEFSNPATSADLLENSGEVFVQKSQFGGGSPMLRGFAANSVLLVVDGVRLNNAIYRSGNLQNIINIDPNALSKAEVIYGPGSIIYGSDALGGVMNFSTVSPDFTEDLEVKVNVLGRYSSAAHENTGHVSSTVSTKNFNYYGSFSYSNFGDLRAGSNRSSAYQGYFERNFYAATLDGADFLVQNEDPNVQIQSGFDLFSTINKFKIKTGTYSDLELALYLSQSSDIPRYDRLALNIGNTDSLTYAEWYYGPQEWLLNKYTFNYRKSNALFDESRITFGYQRYHESRNDRRFGSPSLRSQIEKVDLYTLNIDFNKLFGEDQIYYGVDLFTNLVASNAFRTDLISKEKSLTDSRYPNEGSTYQSFALYLNYLKELKNWTLGLGTRYSAIRLSAKTSNSQINIFDGDYNLNNQAINGMVSLVYRPNKNHKVSGIVSSGFRAPNVDDVGKLFEISDDIVTVPNPDLVPEYTYNQELSYQFKTNKLLFNIVGYHSLLVNTIIRDDYIINGKSSIIIDDQERELRAQVNGGRAQIIGTGLNVKGSLNVFWDYEGAINYSKGKTLNDEEPLRHIPPVFGRVALSRNMEKMKSTLFILYNFSKKPSQIPDTEIFDKPELYTIEGSPRWFTLNIQSEYLITDVFTLQCGVENILDKHYRSYSSGISAAGRNVYFSLRAKI